MKRFEPNLLLAVSTALALAVLVMSAALFGLPGQAVKYGLIAVICPPLFVTLNGLWRRRMGWVRPPMIHPDAPGTAVWAALFPALVMLSAVIPMVFPGHDYGLLVLFAAVWFGVTLESALKARRAG